MTPHIQRLMLKLQRYRYNMSWIAGKYLYVADTLSRAHFAKRHVSSTLGIEVQAHVNMVYKTLPASKGQLENMARETEKDGVLKAVMDCIQNGWRAGRCMAYAQFKEELCIVNGLVLKGTRIVIPSSMRLDMLAKIHVGHMGTEKQKRLARDLMYWPGMNGDIDRAVQRCSACQKYRPQQRKEKITELEPKRDLGPWEKVGVDLFHWENSEYLVVVDYFSNYPEIVKLSSTTAAAVITHLKSIFARHGIPKIVVSDNGPQFSCTLFARFAETYEFRHQTSSPHHPQGNG